jgi:hypothetical protein
MGSSLLYAPPFIDFSPRGVEGLFALDEITELFSILDGMRQTAVDASSSVDDVKPTLSRGGLWSLWCPGWESNPHPLAGKGF